MKTRIAILFCLALSFDPRAWADSAAAAPGGQLTVKTRRVVIFKNGHGLFIKEARGRTGADGTVFTDQVPEAASLGSFWISDHDLPPEAVIASKAVRTERQTMPARAETLFEVLVANRGKRAVIFTEDDKKLEGVIRQVLQTRSRDLAGGPVDRAVSYSMLLRDSSLPAAAPGAAEIHRPTGAHFVLGTEAGDVLIAAADVRRITVPDMALALSQERVSRREVKLLTVRYSKKTQQQEHQLDMIYFRPGIRWIPTYRIDLGDDGFAELVMQAEVINEAEDFQDAAVDFVVGLPTFRFQDVVSPLSLEQVMLNTLRQAAPQVMGQLAAQSFSNAVFDNRDRARQAGRLADGGASAAVSAMAGAELQDLYYYSTRRLSLKKGERAVVEVMRTRVSFRHLYTWDLELGQGSARPPRGQGSPLRTSRNKVWHQIALQNKSGRPWTTGPAMVMERGLPLGQDMMTFTPDGREVHLPVTAAVSVRGVLEEEEIFRKAAARRLHGDSYALVRNRARFRIVNSLRVPVRLRVNAEVAGRCYRASDEAEVVLLGQGNSAADALSPRSRVSWNLEIPAGGERTVEARYLFYIRE